MAVLVLSRTQRREPLFCFSRMVSTSSRLRRLELSMSIYFFSRVRADACHMGKCCFLCFLQIQEQCTGSNDPAVIISDPETFQISDVKMLFQGFLAQLVVKSTRDPEQIHRSQDAPSDPLHPHRLKERRRCR